jgi:hypothetical protein
MHVASIEWLGVLAAWFISFLSAFNWFSQKMFFNTWWKAMGKPESQQPGDGQNMGLVFGVTVLSGIGQAVILALVLDVLARALGTGVSVTQGLVTGLVIGLATAGAALGHRLFAGDGFKVWLIEVSNDVLNWALMGVVLSFWY